MLGKGDREVGTGKREVVSGNEGGARGGRREQAVSDKAG